MKTKRTDAAYFKFPHDGPERVTELLDCSRKLERENARLRAEASAMDALLEVADSAKEWWIGHRPLKWSKKKHLENPEVNVAHGHRLARAVAALMLLDAESDQ